jgi:hypothetical protein
MEKTKQIVKDIWNVRNVDIEGSRYRLIESLRLTCDSSQDNKEKLKDFIEHLMCLAIIKKRECIYKYTAYKKVCYVLATIFEDVGLPGNVRDLFNFGRIEEIRINNIMDALNSWPNANGGHIPRPWTKCQLRSLPGFGKKSVMNIVHFYAHGTLPEINNNNFAPPLYSPTSPPRNIDDQIRESRKDILIRQLHNAVEMLSLENRSLKGSEEITECPICLESEGTMISTPCGHKFHTNCLMEWLKSHDNCPVCRNSLVTD